MAQSHDADESRAAAPRIAGLGGLVVLAVVLARARAAGMTPPTPSPNGSATQAFIRIVALSVMVAAAILLLSGRIRKVQTPGTKVQLKKKKAVAKPSRRVVTACLIGLLFALGMQILGNSVNDQQKKPPPPPASAQQQGDRDDSQDRQRAGAETESGIADKVVLVMAFLTLGALIVVLTRRKSVLVEDDEEDGDEDELVARAMRAARAAVLDREITDARSAIVASFAAMEDALAERGGSVTPQESDTPSEVLYRGIERASLPEPAALSLLRLFREARFSTHPMTDRDRGDADESLGDLLRALGAQSSARAGGST